MGQTGEFAASSLVVRQAAREVEALKMLADDLLALSPAQINEAFENGALLEVLDEKS